MLSERIAAIERGVAYTTFQRLAKRLDIREERLRKVLRFSAATLHRRKAAGRFTLDESNRLYWLESLLDLADQVLEDLEETKAFMTTGNLALGAPYPWTTPALPQA